MKTPKEEEKVNELFDIVKEKSLKVGQFVTTNGDGFSTTSREVFGKIIEISELAIVIGNNEHAGSYLEVDPTSQGFLYGWRVERENNLCNIAVLEGNVEFGKNVMLKLKERNIPLAKWLEERLSTKV